MYNYIIVKKRRKTRDKKVLRIRNFFLDFLLRISNNDDGTGINVGRQPCSKSIQCRPTNKKEQGYDTHKIHFNHHGVDSVYIYARVQVCATLPKLDAL